MFEAQADHNSMFGNVDDVGAVGDESTADLPQPKGSTSGSPALAILPRRGCQTKCRYRELR